ncbi:hypothetical protein [Agromyces sp. LHK192]|uniref:hypothetical protein n=1 Tax=Agromyces sp. LHK192 TaxID=2498704 RepID=UPI000FD704D9|nr:hypothetical protein [Agromyces sp. LHK192]
MKARLMKMMVAAGLGVALTVGGGAAVSASAAPQVWYKITGYSQEECSRTLTWYRGHGARIWSGCHYRTYDHKWAFSYYWAT